MDQSRRSIEYSIIIPVQIYSDFASPASKLGIKVEESIT